MFMLIISSVYYFCALSLRAGILVKPHIAVKRTCGYISMSSLPSARLLPGSLTLKALLSSDKDRLHGVVITQNDKIGVLPGLQ